MTLKETCDLDKKELLKVRNIQKAHYDRRSKLRKFSEGDKCLVLLPTATNKLLAQWKGLYKVLQKVHDLSYILSVDGKLKGFHIRMLKVYVPAEEAAGCIATCENEEELKYLECVVAHFAPPASSEAAVIPGGSEDGPVTVVKKRQRRDTRCK